MHGIPYTKKEIREIERYYQQGESTRSIANKLGRYHSGVIWNLNKLSIKRRNRSEAAKLGVIKGRIKIFKHSFPESSKEMSLEKAYILGILCGDGCISYNKDKRRYQIILSVTNKEFFNKFRECLYKVYKIKPTNEYRISKIKEWNDQYCARLCSKSVCEDLLNYSNFYTKSWIVPNAIKESDLYIKSSFIKGFSDSEGNVDKDAKRISLTSININGLKEIGKLLKEFNIKYTILRRINKGNRFPAYNLRIQDKKSMRIFYKDINFIIKYKKENLKEIINSYKS